MALLGCNIRVVLTIPTAIVVNEEIAFKAIVAKLRGIAGNTSTRAVRALKITGLIGVGVVAGLIVKDSVAHCRIVLFIHQVNVVIHWKELAVVNNRSCVRISPSGKLEIAEGSLSRGLLHEDYGVRDVVVIAK